jgi:hypothetical protein
LLRLLANKPVHERLLHGSDFPFRAEGLALWMSSLGMDRTYAQLGRGRAFDYSDYLDGIRRGCSFATNGPLIFLEVDGQGPGTIIDADNARETVTVFAKAICQYPLDRLEIIANGGVVQTVEGKGGQCEIAFETRLPLKESTWLAARARGVVYPEAYGGEHPWNLHAHTSPVYVHKGGRPIVCRADATAMAVASPA